MFSRSGFTPLRMLYLLALMWLAHPAFGATALEPSKQVLRIAMTSKRNLKRINNPDDVISMPVNLVVSRNAYNIYAGNF
jgi:hypothetical protein